MRTIVHDPHSMTSETFFPKGKQTASTANPNDERILVTAISKADTAGGNSATEASKPSLTARGSSE